MERMIESIRKVGAITPALTRPLPDGGYELISGHRRLAACQVLGIETMPVIVREMSDDEAVIAMVDANLLCPEISSYPPSGSGLASAGVIVPTLRMLSIIRSISSLFCTLNG